MHNKADLPRVPPNGCYGFNDLRRALKIQGHILRAYIRDPDAPKSHGLYVAPNYKIFPYYSLEEFEAFIKKPFQDLQETESFEEESGWAIPAHTAQESTACLLRRNIEKLAFIKPGPQYANHN
jgi:hypothetical protein